MHQPAARDCLGLWILHQQSHLLLSGHPTIYLHDLHLMKLGPSKADSAQTLCSWHWPSIGVESQGDGKTLVSFTSWLPSTYQQWHNSLLRRALSNLHWNLLDEEPVSITAMHRQLWGGCVCSSLPPLSSGKAELISPPARSPAKHNRAAARAPRGTKWEMAPPSGLWTPQLSDEHAHLSHWWNGPKRKDLTCFRN